MQLFESVMSETHFPCLDTDFFSTEFWQLIDFFSMEFWQLIDRTISTVAR